jgi:hypothetical protein
LPDVPTIAEFGYPQYDVAAWFALVAPAGTPEPIVKRLRDEVTKIQAMPTVKSKFADRGAEIVIGGPDEYTRPCRMKLGGTQKSPDGQISSPNEHCQPTARSFYANDALGLYLPTDLAQATRSRSRAINSIMAKPRAYLDGRAPASNVIPLAGAKAA